MNITEKNFVLESYELIASQLTKQEDTYGKV